MAEFPRDWELRLLNGGDVDAALSEVIDDTSWRGLFAQAKAYYFRFDPVAARPALERAQDLLRSLREKQNHPKLALAAAKMRIFGEGLKLSFEGIGIDFDELLEDLLALSDAETRHSLGPQIALLAARQYLVDGRDAAAHESFTRLIEENPDVSFVMKALYHLGRSMALSNLGDELESRRNMEVAGLFVASEDKRLLYQAFLAARLSQLAALVYDAKTATDWDTFLDACSVPETTKAYARARASLSYRDSRRGLVL